MPIVCLGLSHNTAPVEVRERHAFPPSRMAEALVALKDYPAVKEAAMLQTCGRLEIYAELDDYEAGVAQLQSFLGNFGHGSARTQYDLGSYIYTLLGRQAIEHLFRVSTGLDSMLIGEAEILGQVKDAYVAAHQARAIGKTLHRLFGEALNAGKTARSQTRIGDESVSIATAAIGAAKDRLGTLEGRSIVVVGAGTMGRTAAKRLRREGAARVLVTNRTMRRAHELVDDLGFGEAVDLEHLQQALASADIVVTSTGSSHFVLTKETVESAMASRRERPMFIIDIAVPRDADPAVADIANVALVDIDGLRCVVDETLELRREAIPDVEEIIDEYMIRFAQWYQLRLAVPVIASLTQKAERVRTAEVERLFGRCPDLTERERMLISGMSLTIVSKLLHSVIVKIREKAAVNASEALSQARVLDELFELDLAGQIAALIPQPQPAEADD